MKAAAREKVERGRKMRRDAIFIYYKVRRRAENGEGIEAGCGVVYGGAECWCELEVEVRFFLSHMVERAGRRNSRVC